ncbi:MAG: helix-turn-helix transcriptional regulator [Isosphaerales bacterium]
MNEPKRSEYQFTLTMDGVEELTFEGIDRLFEAGCDDATFGTRCGTHFATFHRDAASATEAMISAIEDVERARVGLRVVRIEPDELVTAGEIAERGGLSREAIRLYVLAKRGPGGFPRPVAGLHQKSPLYRWSDVAAWLDRLPGGSKRLDTALADSIAFLNAALDLRRLAPSVQDAEAAFQRLRSKPRRLASSVSGKPRTRERM